MEPDVGGRGAGRRLPLVWVLALLLGGCFQSPPPRLVLLYATCTLNKQFLSPYSPSVVFTPNLARFADEAAVFEKHRTETGMSGVAFAALFSGGHAPEHGVFTHPTKLDDSVTLVTEVFGQGGYEPFFWGGHKLAGPALNYAQGVAPDAAFVRGLRADDHRFRQILRTLRHRPEYRAFVVTNFTVTHTPYPVAPLNDFCEAYRAECGLLDRLAPGEAEEFTRLSQAHIPALKYNFPEAARRLGLTGERLDRFAAFLELVYRADVSHLDGMFGRVLAAIADAGLADEAVVVFTADHGETLYDPAAPFEWSHAFTLRADSLEIPLLVRGAGVVPGRVAHVTRSIDVFPTLAGLAGLSLPEDVAVEGRDLSGTLAGGPAPDLVAFSHSAMVPPVLADQPKSDIAHLESYYPDVDIGLSWVGLRADDTVWKYRRLPGQDWAVSAFDLAKDPVERKDVFRAGAQEHERMAERLVAYKEELTAAKQRWDERRGDDATVSSEELVERLRALGYVR